MDGLQFNIDAAKAGNETRFINHPVEPKHTNCKAEWKYVGGELRLGIYASKHIYVDQELFLNYGKSFFMDQYVAPAAPGPSEPASPTPSYEDVMDEQDMRGLNDDDEDESGYETVANSDSSASL
ncbi:hypothetical protein FRC10_008049 [Ceratobasidium sp. 414]|nr:hypothetical protein FRC10_008049 [Ceratobasidium sp. 414]